MQYRFQLARIMRARRFRRCLAALVLVPGLSLESAGAEPFVSAWSTGPKSSVRLIAASSAASPRLWRAGVEVRLVTGALTYWRSPGGVGIAPEFAFADSVNVAAVAVAYPAPRRIEEEGTAVYGYRDAVTFPLGVTPREAAHPMRLALTLSFAVCERICLPATATAILDLPPSQPGSLPDALHHPATGSLDLPVSPPEDEQGQAIAWAEALVPRRLSERERDAAISITVVEGASPPSWRVVVHEDLPRDLFVEAGDGWYFETRKAAVPGTFLIVQAETPMAGGDAAVPVTLTLAGPRQSYEFSAVLDRKTMAR
jgi:DsbC/DsbD-like thiol-disulfide interchange protein